VEPAGQPGDLQGPQGPGVGAHDLQVGPGLAGVDEHGQSGGAEESDTVQVNDQLALGGGDVVGDGVAKSGRGHSVEVAVNPRNDGRPGRVVNLNAERRGRPAALHPRHISDRSRARIAGGTERHDRDERAVRPCGRRDGEARPRTPAGVRPVSGVARGFGVGESGALVSPCMTNVPVASTRSAISSPGMATPLDQMRLDQLLGERAGHVDFLRLRVRTTRPASPVGRA
jgi:hypothetical protein